MAMGDVLLVAKAVKLDKPVFMPLRFCICLICDESKLKKNFPVEHFLKFL